MWTLALALEKTLGFADKSEADNVTSCSGWHGELVPLEHFNYSNGYMGCVIRWALAQTDYIGALVSGLNIIHMYMYSQYFSLNLIFTKVQKLFTVLNPHAG